MTLDSLSILQAQDVVWVLGVIVILLSTLIQNLSKKYKPWTWIAEQLGKAINKEMLEKQTKLEEKVDKLEKKIEKRDVTDEKEHVLESRRRILSFGDEIRLNVKHSEEYFNNIIDDINIYNNYCKNHPEFENSKAVITIKIIEEVWEKCLRENDFL